MGLGRQANPLTVDDQVDMKGPPPRRRNRILQGIMEGFPPVNGIARNDAKALRNPNGVHIDWKGTSAQAVQHDASSRFP